MKKNLESMTQAQLDLLCPFNRDGKSLGRIERLVVTCRAALAAERNEKFNYVGLNNSDNTHETVLSGHLHKAVSMLEGDKLPTIENDLNAAAVTLMTVNIAKAFGLLVDKSQDNYKVALSLLTMHEADNYSDLISIKVSSSM